MRSKNVVVLESNVTLQQELKEAMESSEELRVVYAGDDGEAGIKQIQQLKPEMAVVGMFLKGTDGCGVIRAIRKQGGTTKIIATGVSNDALMEKAMNEGAGLLSGEAVFDQRSDRADERADERARRRRRRKGVREREEKAADVGREDQRHIHIDRDTAAHQGIRIFERRDQTDGREAVHHQQRDEGIISEHREEV